MPGDSVYVIRTQSVFPNAGGYSLHLIPDGTKSLSRSGGFEFTANVYREVTDEYISSVYTKYDEFKNAGIYIDNAYYNLEQLSNALKAGETGPIELKAIS